MRFSSTKGFNLIDGVMNKTDSTYHKIGSGSILIELGEKMFLCQHFCL